MDEAYCALTIPASGLRRSAKKSGQNADLGDNAPMQRLIPWVVWFSLMALSPIAMAQVFRCVDGNGRVTLADRPCKDASVPATGPRNKPAGVLEAAQVEKVVRQAAEFAVRANAKGQCSLAAPSLKFAIEVVQGTESQAFSGGQPELCRMQQDSAQAISSGNMAVAIKINRLDIEVVGAQAIARYDSVMTFKQNGLTVLLRQCKHEETLASQGGQVLFLNLVNSCKISP
jgi:hypothetical protein